MKYERLEVRLDEDDVKKVAELKAVYETSVSDVVRRAIDEAYERVKVQQRKEALEVIKQANLEEMPDPEELKRQIVAGYDIDLP